MEKYIVIITETLERTIEVEANSVSEALEIASDAYSDEVIVLDASDFVDNNFECVEGFDGDYELVKDGGEYVCRWKDD